MRSKRLHFRISLRRNAMRRDALRHGRQLPDKFWVSIIFRRRKAEIGRQEVRLDRRFERFEHEEVTGRARESQLFERLSLQQQIILLQIGFYEIGERWFSFDRGSKVGDFLLLLVTTYPKFYKTFRTSLYCLSTIVQKPMRYWTEMLRKI